MADEKIGIGVPIVSTADTSGAEKMADALDQTTEAGKGASEGAKELKINYEALGEAIRLFVEGAGLIEFLRESVKEFYEDEKAIRAVSGAALVLGQDQAAARAETEKFTRALSLLSGIADNELTAAVGKAYIATGDLKEAQSRASLAADIATRMGWDYAKSLTVVEQAVNGQGKELAKLVPEIKGAKDAHEAAQIAVDGLEKKFRGATVATKDQALAVDQAHVRWQLFQKEIGSALLPAINGIRDAFQDVIVWIEKTAQKAGVLIESMTHGASIVGEAISKALKGHIGDAVNFLLESAKKSRVEVGKQMDEIDKDFVDKRKKNEADLVKIVQEAANQKVSINDNLRQKEEKDEKVHHDFWTSDTKAFLKEWEKYQKNRALMAKETDDEILQHFFGMSAKELEIQGSTEKQSEKILKETLRKKKEAAKLEIEMQKEIGNAVISAATSAFGDSKELSIASAVINTYEGATKALAQGGIYGAVLAAVVIAAGLAQVAKIESTDPQTSGSSYSTSGSGFDDPANDQAAYLGGRRWANDMIGKWTAGVSSGWATGMGANSTQNVYNQQTYNNSRQTTVQTSIQDPTNVEAAKKLLRTLKMVDQNVLGSSSTTGRK